MGGRLVFVVGASGVGKDTLMMGARAALANADGVRFVRRVITRTPDPGAEDHDSLTPEAFAAAHAAGAFALTWHAHGLDYGLPARLDADLAHGLTMIANGRSRDGGRDRAAAGARGSAVAGRRRGDRGVE